MLIYYGKQATYTTASSRYFDLSSLPNVPATHATKTNRYFEYIDCWINLVYLTRMSDLKFILGTPKAAKICWVALKK